MQVRHPLHSVSFHAFVQTQFNRPIVAFQTDNSGLSQLPCCSRHCPSTHLPLHVTKTAAPRESCVPSTTALAPCSFMPAFPSPSGLMHCTQQHTCSTAGLAHHTATSHPSFSCSALNLTIPTSGYSVAYVFQTQLQQHLTSSLHVLSHVCSWATLTTPRAIDAMTPLLTVY